MADDQTAPTRRRRRTSSNKPQDQDDGSDDAAAIAGDSDRSVYGEGDSTDYAGTKLLVTWGKEHIQPVRFQGLDVGPFDMTVVVQDGESPLDAYHRGIRHLNAIAEAEYETKLPAFIKRCAAVANDL